MRCLMFHARKGLTREVKLGVSNPHDLRGVALRCRGKFLVVCTSEIQQQQQQQQQQSEGRWTATCRFLIFDLFPGEAETPLVREIEPLELDYFGRDRDGGVWVMVGHSNGPDEGKVFAAHFNRSLLALEHFRTAAREVGGGKRKAVAGEEEEGNGEDAPYEKRRKED